MFDSQLPLQLCNEVVPGEDDRTQFTPQQLPISVHGVHIGHLFGAADNQLELQSWVKGVKRGGGAGCGFPIPGTKNTKKHSPSSKAPLHKQADRESQRALRSTQFHSFSR